MKRNLEASAHFEKQAAKFFQHHPELKTKTSRVFTLLMQDLFQSALKTHKLSGKLHHFYGCSISHTYRIIFGFDNEKVYLHDIGSHDEVY